MVTVNQQGGLLALAKVWMPVIRQLETALLNHDEVGDLQSQLEQWIQVAQTEMQTLHYDNATIEDCTFAVVAWVDEYCLDAHKGAVAGWSHRPLQAAYFGTFSAGTEFFEKLKYIKEQKSDALAVYALMLVMGFEGVYASNPVALVYERKSSCNGVLQIESARLTDHGLWFPESLPNRSAQSGRRWRVHWVWKVLLLGSAALAVLYGVLSNKLQQQISLFLMGG